MARKSLMGVDFNNQRGQNVADGTNPTDVVNVQQMQAFVRGLSWKASARAATTANLSLTAPGASIDGVTLSNGDRVLVRNQTTASENGIYVWNGASTALTRASDADTAAKLSAATVLVTEGTTNADKAFTQTADGITVGTTSIVWVQFGGGGTVYTAGNGLQLSASQFSVVAGNGIIADGTSTRVDSTVVVRKYAANVGDGSASSITVLHGLGTADLTYSLRNTSTGEFVDTDAVVNTASPFGLTFTFPSAPASGAYRVVVHV